MEKHYFKFEITLKKEQIKPIPTHLMIESFNKVWNWAKKYRNLQNATDNSWTNEAISEMIAGHDAILDEYPFPFVENLLNTFLKEFEARNYLGYTIVTEDDGEEPALPELEPESINYDDEELPDDVFG
jgi:hypothetical protein